jgi:hypothetical protein
VATLSAARLPQASAPAGSKPSASAGQSAPGTSAKPAGKSHVMSGEFVSVDTTANTITVKDSKGKTVTASLKDKAMTEAATLKAGDKLWLTTWAAPAGSTMMTVSSIRVEHATKK